MHKKIGLLKFPFIKCLKTISISLCSISPFAFSLTNNCHTHPKIARQAHYSNRKISLQKKKLPNTKCTKVMNNLEGIFMLNIYIAPGTLT